MRSPWVVGLLVLAALPAAAQPLRVSGPASGCPAAERVAAALRHALPEAPVAVGEAVPGATAVRVSDAGASYRVEVTAPSADRPDGRDFSDPARRCEERARAAAVFVALAVTPPLPVEVPIGPLVTSPRWAVTAPPARGVQVDLAVAAIAQVAPGSGAAGGGAAVELALGRDLGWAAVAGVVGVAGVFGAQVELPGAVVAVQRLPFSAAARLLWRRGRLELAGEVGGGLALLLLEAAGLPQGAGLLVRAEPLLRLATQLRLRVQPRLALFLALEGQYAPLPYALSVEPQGVLGQTPQGWLGVALGATGRIKE